MKRIVCFLSMFFIIGCSVNPDAFLKQVSGKEILEEGTSVVMGSFSADGKRFNFTGGTIPMKFKSAQSDNSGEYTQHFTEQVLRVYMTINGSKITINVQNGTPPQTFDLVMPTPK